MTKRKTQKEKVIETIFHVVDWNIKLFDRVPSVSDVLLEIRKVSNTSPYLFGITKKIVEERDYFDGPRGTASSFLSELVNNKLEYDKLSPLVLDFAKELKFFTNCGTHYIYTGDLGSIFHCKLGLTDVSNDITTKEKSSLHGKSQYMLSSIFNIIGFNIFVPKKDSITEKGDIYESFDIDQTLSQSSKGRTNTIDFTTTNNNITVFAEVEESTGVLTGINRMKTFSNEYNGNNNIFLIVSSKPNYKEKFNDIVENNKDYKKMNLIFIEYSKLEQIYNKVLDMVNVGNTKKEIENYVLNKLQNKNKNNEGRHTTLIIESESQKFDGINSTENFHGFVSYVSQTVSLEQISKDFNTYFAKDLNNKKEYSKKAIREIGDYTLVCGINNRIKKSIVRSMGEKYNIPVSVKIVKKT